MLGVAAATTILFQRLGQPVVLGYLIAGLIIGPHVPIPLVADPEIVETLSELGVILLMFSVGLELRLRTLVRMAPTAGVTAVIQCSLMVWLGFLTGRLFGWTLIESLFAGAAIAISSTTIIAKAFDEQRIHGRLRETVVGILVVEDLIAILLIAVLTAIATGSRLSAGSLLMTVGRLAAFLIALSGRGDPDRAARDARDRPPGSAGDHGDRQHGDLLRGRAAGARVRLLGGAGRVHRRLAGRGVGRGEEDRAPDPAGARRLRRGLLRVGRHDDRPGADRRATRWRSRC